MMTRNRNDNSPSEPSEERENNTNNNTNTKRPVTIDEWVDYWYLEDGANIIPSKSKSKLPIKSWGIWQT